MMKEQKKDEEMFQRCGICCGTETQFKSSGFVTMSFENEKKIIRVQKVHKHCWHNAWVLQNCKHKLLD